MFVFVSEQRHHKKQTQAIGGSEASCLAHAFSFPFSGKRVTGQGAELRGAGSSAKRSQTLLTIGLRLPQTASDSRVIEMCRGLTVRVIETGRGLNVLTLGREGGRTGEGVFGSPLKCFYL